MHRTQKCLLLLFLFVLSSCTNSYRQLFDEMETMPTPDYSYIVEPTFNVSQEASEELLSEFFSAEEVKIKAVGFHGYEKTTKKQIGEKYWLKTVLLNSSEFGNLKDDVQFEKITKEIAERLIKDIGNVKDYEKLEVTLLQQWNDGIPKQIKRNTFYTLPDLVETNF